VTAGYTLSRRILSSLSEVEEYYTQTFSRRIPSSFSELEEYYSQTFFLIGSSFFDSSFLFFSFSFLNLSSPSSLYLFSLLPFLLSFSLSFILPLSFFLPFFFFFFSPSDSSEINFGGIHGYDYVHIFGFSPFYRISFF
jgi:hypothetical protein